MVKKEEKSEEIKVTDDCYIFPDGIQITKERVQKQVRMSKLNDFEKEQMELSAGKSYEMIIAEGLHRKDAAEREADLKRTAELQARYEAERKRGIQHGKDAFDNGLLMIIHDGKMLTALEPVPPVSDDDWIAVYNYSCRIGSMVMGEDVRASLELVFLEKKFPGYRFILLRK